MSKNSRAERARALYWALLAVSLMLLTACGASSAASSGGHAGATATATAKALASLPWTPVKLPTGFTAAGGNLTISPVNGYDAWMCQSISANTYVIWKTIDAGQSWRQTGRFSYTAPLAGASCSLNADQTGTSALLATISWGCGECRTLDGASVFSADGATQWTPISGYV